jgi:hypothetical protein
MLSGVLVVSARKLQQSLSAEYGQTIESIERTRPIDAQILREYVAALRSEAAAYRREAHRLRCQLELRSR